jgi:hypothetical protein
MVRAFNISRRSNAGRGSGSETAVNAAPWLPLPDQKGMSDSFEQGLAISG